MPLVTIDPERCTGDGLCQRVCQKVFSCEAGSTIPSVAHEESCNSCGHCALVCPSGAITQSDSPAEKIHHVQRSLLPAYEQVREMIVSRRSVRTFQKRPVEKEQIDKLIDGARYAPSLKNSQSTRYTVVQDKNLLDAIASATAQWLGKIAHRLKNPLWRKLYMLRGEKDIEQVRRWISQLDTIARKMRDGTDVVLFEAPLLLLFRADQRMRSGDINATLALHNATLIASSLGLGCFYTGYVVTAFAHEPALGKLIGLAAHEKVYGGLALGYPSLQFSRWIERREPSVTWL